jgi:hypothetical protein
MATLAVGAKLPAMNVGMAIRTAGTRVSEDHAGVALSAAHLLVHPTQRISRLVMIEFGIRTNRLPANAGMAVLAGERQGAVRIRNLGLGAAHRLLRACMQWQNQYDGCNKLS